MPPVQKRLHFWAVGVLASRVVRALSATWRVRIEDPDQVIRRVVEGRQQALFTFWHRHILPLLALYRHHPFVLPVSEHEDGEYVAQVMHRMGLKSVRGSTTRGSLKLLRGMLGQIRAGRSPAITPDGPRGPRFSVQPGFILLARRSGLPVYALGVAAKDAWELPSWDRFHIPKPLTTVAVAFRQAFSADELRTNPGAERASLHLKDCLKEAEAAARGLLDTPGENGGPPD